MLKILFRVLVGALVASAAAWFLAIAGTVLVPTWTSREPTGLNAMGSQLGIFFVASLVGLTVLKLLLNPRGRLVHYLAGGAVVGMAAGLLAAVLANTNVPFLPFVLLTGAMAGLAGGAPLRGGGG